MKLKTLLLTGFTCAALTACTSSPKIPQLETGVLQEVQNLDVYPDTTNNKAKLTKFVDKCIIEFTGNLDGNKVVEQWSFRGNTLITGGTATFAKDGTSQASNFDLNNAQVQQNFIKLRKNFAKDAVAQCN
ncbi:hypothetical protein [Acinetobacter tandoii]|jgi:hypothetical protein|uniref:Uncharacterized protein n=2 Tax=Acinetobacter tandoii TaxID=202954 RepID=R9APZ0_9GAMM|nr:hypothetical protein [Acinetobacter tandoii]EOR04253.1 hypothetical protein I593_03330 [Acinetobacter tandoii DSM 14970 = CIP 107469]KAB1855840.1 hypothetical protein F4W09_08535 [Acinetobacter tandoii]